MLEALPLELMYQIYDWLVRDDIQALALTCRTIARQTKSRRFLSIRVTYVDERILETLESDPEIASAVNEVIFDFPSEFDPYTLLSNETLSKYIQRLFFHLVHLSIVAWTSPRAPNDAILNLIATQGVRNISFIQHRVWYNIGTVLQKTLCEMKLDSFCHVQGEKLPTVLPPIKPISPRADLKALSLIYTEARLEPPQEPLALKSVIFRQLDDVSTILPTILNSKHLTCIVLRINTAQGAEPLDQWLEGSPVYPSLRTFDFGVKRDFPDTFLSTKLLPFLSNHPSLTYLDIDLYVDGIFGTLAAILQQMKSLEFFGFATIVKKEYLEYESLFKYLYPLLSALPSRLGGLEIGAWCWLTDRPELSTQDRRAFYGALAQQFPYLNYFLTPPISVNSHESAKQYQYEASVVAGEMKCLEWVQEGPWTYRVIRQDPNSSGCGRGVRDIVLWGYQVRHPWNPREPRKSKLFGDVAVA